MVQVHQPNSYLPTYNLYNYSFSQQIYTVDEIGEQGFINNISFKAAGDKVRDLDIYVVNTDKTSFASGSDWITVTADDLVYSGNVTMVAESWVTIPFNQPFAFEGENMAIIVDDNTKVHSRLIRSWHRRS